MRLRLNNHLKSVNLYCTNAFMLQAIIYNTNTEQNVVGKVVDSLGKLAITVNKSVVEAEKPAIEKQKLTIEALKSAIEKQKYSKPTIENIIKVYNAIESNQIFGTKEIEDILGCSGSTARAIMMKLRDVQVVVSIIGKGKGKYVFICQQIRENRGNNDKRVLEADFRKSGC